MDITANIRKNWQRQGVKFKNKPLLWIKTLRTAHCSLCGRNAKEEFIDQGFSGWSILTHLSAIDGKAPEICPKCLSALNSHLTVSPPSIFHCSRCGVSQKEKIFGVGLPGWVRIPSVQVIGNTKQNLCLCPNCTLELQKKLGSKFTRGTWTALTYASGSLLTSTKMSQNQANFEAIAKGHSGAPSLLISNDIVKFPAPGTDDWLTPSWENASSGGGGDDIQIEIPPDMWQALSYTGQDYQRIAFKETFSSKTISQVKFYMKCESSWPAKSIHARIRKVSDGSVIKEANEAYSGDDISSSGEWILFTFNQFVNEAAYLSVEFDEGSGYSPMPAVGLYDVGFPYEDGRYCYYGSDSAWHEVTSYDTCVQVIFQKLGSNTVDDNLTTCWHPVPENEANAWISWDLEELAALAGCRIYWGAESAYRPTAYHIQVSEDNTAWTTVITETEAPPASAWKEYLWNVKAARYVKLSIDTHGASGTKVYEVDDYWKNIVKAFTCHGHDTV